MLDFQDAVYGPITYDIAILMRDAFLSWDEEFVLDCIVRYWERAKKGRPARRSGFRRVLPAVEWMGLQRHIKVLGHLLPHQLPRRQAAIPGRSAALHRLCAQGGRALSRRCVRSRACSMISKAAPTKSATRSNRAA